MLKHGLFIISFSICLLSCGDKSSRVDSTAVNNNSPSSYIDSLNKAIVENPSNAKLFVLRAEYYESQNDLVRAAEELDRAKVIEPENCSHYSQKAKLLIALRNYQGAVGELQKCLAQNPEDVGANLVMAELLLRTEAYDEAVSFADRVLKVDVFNDEAYFIKGMIFKSAGDTSRAISSFLTATEQNNSHYEAFLQLGLLYAIAGNDMAIDFYNNALRIDSSSIEVLYNRGLFEQSNNRVRTALKTYSEILKLDSADAKAHYNKGYIYLTQIDELDSAAMSFEASIQAIPNWTDAVYNLGLVAELKGNREEALQYYKNALALDPTHTLSAKGLSRLGI
ncbi:MAG TPA: hypothetical protein DCS15_02720 [Flavobacteriales bacterium]|jgi:tetratricopeptide (TPR) repeat protein|nr:tetratricopeptide repeat protein [Salibacteraceae bacterium]HAS35373.1 hypothetical protein [Flavobacteriales bacterium]